MVCLTHNNLISPEAQALIARRAYGHEGLRQLAALLPASDAELHQWLSGASDAMDSSAFQMLISAAAISRRKLEASLLTPAMLMQFSPWNLAWIAWHMEGNVTEELLRGLEAVTVRTGEGKALALFVAAAWWLEHRKGEPPPQQILRLAKQLMEGEKPDLRTSISLENLAFLLEEKAFLQECARSKAQTTPSRQRLQLKKAFALLNGPFEKFLYERETNVYQRHAPQRRAVEHIGRNEVCPCGSGKKYKRCCEAADRERLRRSSSVPGVTCDELAADADAPLTEARLSAMSAPEVLRLDPNRVPPDLQKRYIVSLGVLKHYEEAVAAFRIFGVPEYLHSVWSQVFSFATESWRPDIARQLMEVFPDAEEKLGERAHAGIRVLLVGDDPARVLQEVEASVERLLESRDLYELQRLVWALLTSPYRGLGVLLARSVLPIVDEEYVPGLFDGILDARAKLNLTGDDEFSDWMDEHALRKSHQHETAAAQEAQDKLAAKMEELRGVKEEKARLERERDLHNRQERRESERLKAAPGPEAEALARNRELNAKIERLSALMSEGGKEKLELRRKLEQATRENEALKSGNGTGEPKQAEEDDDFEVPGNQPVRLLQFPLDFAETVGGVSRHVGRATMNRLGRLASGEPSAFHAIKQLKAYPEVLRARVSDKFRLLFCLTPDHVRVVDLIRRADLDRRIDRLKASGLPPIG